MPLLVLATRADEEGAMKAAGVARVLGLGPHPPSPVLGLGPEGRVGPVGPLLLNRPWRVQSCSAISLVGVRDGLQWLHGEMKDRKSWES